MAMRTNSYLSAFIHVLSSLLLCYHAARQHVYSAMGLQQHASLNAMKVILPSGNSNLHRILSDYASYYKEPQYLYEQSLKDTINLFFKKITFLTFKYAITMQYLK